MIVSKNLESLKEPLESFKQSHASLFPEHTCNLSLVIFLLLHMIGELRLFIIAHGHWSSLLEHL